MNCTASNPSNRTTPSTVAISNHFKPISPGFNCSITRRSGRKQERLLAAGVVVNDGCNPTLAPISSCVRSLSHSCCSSYAFICSITQIIVGIVLCQMFARSIASSILLIAILTSFASPVRAQSESTSNSASKSGGDAAQQNHAVRFSLDSQTKLGSYPFVPGHWSDLHLRLENSGNAPHDLLCTSYFEASANLQYGRQVWLPPHARLTLSHPALIPTTPQGDATSINVNSLLIDRSSGSEVLLKTEAEQLRHDRTLLLTQPSRITGVVYDGNGDVDVLKEVMNLVVACRVTQVLTNKVTMLADDFLPSDENSLRYLDHLVIADNRLTDDYAALAAVRRWLHGGGRLWVMLDRVKPEILERLLGDDFQGHVSDRVSLTSIRVDSAPTFQYPEGQPGETVTYDDPVNMSRLVVSGMKVLNTVDGWPAAMTMPYGEGRLVITTLGPRAWIKPTPANTPVPKDPQMRTAYVPRTPMSELSTLIMAKRESPLLMNADVESLAREYISYKIPGRPLIASAMSGFLVTLLLAGISLWWFQRLEHFGWIGSLLAAIASLLFLGIGQSSRQGVPPTEASFELAQAISGTDDIRRHGAVAVYRTEPVQAPIQTHQGGVIGTDQKNLDGVTVRMITTDLREFRLEGLPQPSGMKLFSESTSRSNPQRYEARATFNEQGVVGRVAGNTGAGADMLLATRFGRMGVKMSAEGTWTGGVDDIFVADQYLAASFLGTEQERRRRILETLFSEKNWSNVLQRPKLLVWLKDWPPGFEFGDGLTRVGQTLLVLPVDITRPPVGTQMQIPAPLIRFGNRRPPDGSAPNGCWDENLGEFQSRTSPCTTWLGFQIPSTLLPAKLSKVSFTIKVSGAIGQIEILSFQNNAVVSLQKLTNPVGTVQAEISDVSALNLNEAGDLIIGIKAGDPAKAASSGEVATTKVGQTVDYWKIESLGLNVWATTSDEVEKD